MSKKEFKSFFPKNYRPKKIAGTFNDKDIWYKEEHGVKIGRIRSYTSPYFPAFALNTGKYKASLRIQSKCVKIWIRIVANTETIHAVEGN